jgi:hypothetical protein
MMRRNEVETSRESDSSVAAGAQVAEAERLAEELARATAGVSHWIPPGPMRPRYEAATQIVTKLVSSICAVGKTQPRAASPAAAAAFERLASEAVFVGGVRKSGTTLLRNLLDHHPALLVFPVDGVLGGIVARGRGETHDAQRDRALAGLLLHLLVGGLESGDPVWALVREPGHIEPYLDLARYYYGGEDSRDPRGILLAMLRALVAIDPAVAARRRWVIKGKFTDQVVQELGAAFPSARFIHIVRHPCAVIASQKRKQPRAGSKLDLFYQLETQHDGLRLAAEMRQTQGARRYHVLRYEDLVRDPGPAAQGIARFLGIEADPILTRPTMYGRPSGANTGHPELLGNVGVVSSATTETWRTALSTHEIAVIESYLGPAMERFGYRRAARGVATYGLNLIRVAWRYRTESAVERITAVKPILRGAIRAMAHRPHPAP